MSKKNNKFRKRVRKTRRTKLILGVVLIGVAVVFGGMYLTRNQTPERAKVMVPSLSPEALLGQTAYQAHCVACHGENAAGTEKGPTLINSIYRPAHHGDFSFVRAATLGVPQHHWLFGSMPPVPNVSRKEIDQIVVYVRELQRANGIH